MPGEITPFRISVPDADLADLRERLRRTRWPEPETSGDWSQGVPLSYLQDLCGYWAGSYDWRACEARLNALPQYRTGIGGLPIHFLHVRSPHPGAPRRPLRRVRAATAVRQRGPLVLPPRPVSLAAATRTRPGPDRRVGFMIEQLFA